MDGKKESKKNDTRPQQADPLPPEPEKPVPRTTCTPDELKEYQQLLLKKRAELVGDVKHMTSEALSENRPGGAGNLSTVPIHMADIGSDKIQHAVPPGR